MKARSRPDRADVVMCWPRQRWKGEDVLAGLQPGHPAEPGNIQQHAPADQPVTEDLDGTDAAPSEVTCWHGWPL
jgi:hypothetical protein